MYFIIAFIFFAKIDKKTIPNVTKIRNFVEYDFIMNENLDAYGKSFSKQELEIERALRPEAFENFAGQEQVVENLLIFTRAAVQRGESLDHVLLH